MKKIQRIQLSEKKTVITSFNDFVRLYSVEGSKEEQLRKYFKKYPKLAFYKDIYTKWILEEK